WPIGRTARVSAVAGSYAPLQPPVATMNAIPARACTAVRIRIVVSPDKDAARGRRRRWIRNPVAPCCRMPDSFQVVHHPRDGGFDLRIGQVGIAAARR